MDKTEETTEKKSSGFVFGSQKPKAEISQPFGGFVFGKPKPNETGEGKVESEKEKSTEKKEVDLSTFLPKPGNWTCDVCMISNPGDKEKCLACETPQPRAKSSCDDLMSKFMPSKTNWTCDACMISNTNDKDKCVACETLKVGDKPSLLSVFKPNTGNWACDVCMISNKPEALKCLACETPKQGTQATVKVPETKEFSFGSSGGFKFQGDTNCGNKSTGFVFGTSTSPLESQPKSGGFVFGGTSVTESGYKAGGFVFGGSSVTESEHKPGGLVFGGKTHSKESESPSSGFIFGSSVPSPPPDTQHKSESRGFIFGDQVQTLESGTKTEDLVFGAGKGKFLLTFPMKIIFNPIIH